MPRIAIGLACPDRIESNRGVSQHGQHQHAGRRKRALDDAIEYLRTHPEIEQRLQELAQQQEQRLQQQDEQQQAQWQEQKEEEEKSNSP